MGAAQCAAASGRWQQLMGTCSANGGEDLLKRLRLLAEGLSQNGKVIAAVQAWDQANAAANEAWQEHNDRLQAAAKAVAEEQAPPDSWLSEVRYREMARAYLAYQVAAEQQLLPAAQSCQ